MRILGIHYFAPPVAVVSSRRLAAIYDVWAKRAESIDLITCEEHEQRVHENDFQHTHQLHLVASRGIREIIFGNEKTSIASEAKKVKGFGLLNRWRQSFPLLYLTDEGGPSYYQNALQRGRELIRKKKITHLFSSYRPWVDHRVAAALKREFPNIYWIADFRDLPVDPMRKDVIWPKWQLREARSIVQQADEVWAVSEGQAQQLAGIHPSLKVVYNGLVKLPQPSNPLATEYFTINYTGSLYPGLQSLKLLQDAFRHPIFVEKLTLLSAKTTNGSHSDPDFPDDQDPPKARYNPGGIRWQYAGKDGSVWEEWMDENSGIFANMQIYKYANLQKKSTSPTLSKSQASNRQDTAATNLLLTWSGQNYHGVLTAKLYDYLAAGRPITAIINGPDDPELRRIIEGSNAGRVFCDGQTEELAQWLTELYTVWSTNNGRLPWTTDAESIRYLQMKEQLKELPSR